MALISFFIEAPEKTLMTDTEDGASAGGSGCSEDDSTDLQSVTASLQSDLSAGPQRASLSARETRAVIRSRALLVFVLLVSSCLIAVFTFKYTTAQEESDFETRVRNNAMRSCLFFYCTLEVKQGTNS
jgi:hypothetical protein